MTGSEETQSYPIERLREFSTRVFRHFGVPEADARQAADVLATSDLRGIDSHGVARLHTYFDMLTLGRINPRPEVRSSASCPARRRSTATTGWAWSSAPGRTGSRWRRPKRSARDGSASATRTISASRATIRSRPWNAT